MNLRRKFTICAISIFLACTGCANKRVIDDGQKPETIGSLVFLGTVMGNEGVDGQKLRTTIVHVDDLYLLRGTYEIGKEVILLGDNVPERGQYVFHAEPVQFDSRITATLLRTDPAKTLAKNDVAKLVRMRRKQELQPLIKSSELVVVGEIVATQPWRGQPVESEHDPNFNWLTMKTKEILKGQDATELKVLYSASDDIQWYRSPKPPKGASGVFLIQKGFQMSKSVPAEAWTLLRPGDWLQDEDIAIVRELVREGGVK